MKKNIIIFFFGVLVFVSGCRSENLYPEGSSNAPKGKFTFKQIPKENILKVINFLSTNTENFKVPLRKTSAHNKTETVFGEISTEYIIESTTENRETYYTFSVIPRNEEATTSEIYNLEIRADDINGESAKIVVYSPTEEWNDYHYNNFEVFSGNVSVYSLDGNLDSSVDYQKAMGSCNTDTEPCPDCPTTTDPPIPPGNGGGGGGGTPPNPPNPPNDDPTPPVPPTNDPPTNPPGGGTGGGSGGGGGGGGGGQCFVHCEEDEEGELKCWVMCLGAKTTLSLKAACNSSGSGVVITRQQTPCEKAKHSTSVLSDIIKNNSVSPKLGVLKTHALNSNVEYGVTISSVNNTYSATDPYTDNNPGSVTPILPNSGDYVAFAHTHPDGGATPPSVPDFYNSIQNSVSRPNYKGGLTYSHDGSVFAFVVTNKQEATAFLNAYPSNTNLDSGEKLFNNNTQLGKDFNKILEVTI